MLIWMILLVGVVFAVLGLRLGVFTMFTVVFNLLLAIYLSIMSTPLIVRSTPDLEMGYYAAFSMLLMAIFLFVLLQGFAWYFFLRGSDVLFPNLFDKLAGASLGFVTGYGVLTIIILTFCIMPISRMDYAGGFLPVQAMDQFSADSASKICNFMAACSLEHLGGAAEETTEYLISLAEEKSEEPPAPPKQETAPGNAPTPDPSKEKETTLENPDPAV